MPLAQGYARLGREHRFDLPEQRALPWGRAVSSNLAALMTAPFSTVVIAPETVMGDPMTAPCTRS